MCKTKPIRAKITRKKVLFKKIKFRNQVYERNHWKLFLKDGVSEAEAREQDRQDSMAQAVENAIIAARARRRAREFNFPKKRTPNRGIRQVLQSCTAHTSQQGRPQQLHNQVHMCTPPSICPSAQQQPPEQEIFATPKSVSIYIPTYLPTYLSTYQDVIKVFTPGSKKKSPKITVTAEGTFNFYILTCLTAKDLHFYWMSTNISYLGLHFEINL